MSFLVFNHLEGEERAGCFAKIVSEYDQEIPQSQTADCSKFVFLVSRDGCVALPRGAMGLSAGCDCGIS